MGPVDPTIAIIVSLGFLVGMLYKKVNLGIVLNATALLLAFLALDLPEIPDAIRKTTVDLSTISIVVATFGIMLLSQIYKETGTINKLSESISRIINNPKIVLTVLPAIIGLLPVAGGALMSAPLVDREAEKLNIKSDRKAYINLWFRHTVFPVYPISPPIITTALVTGIAIPLIILRQIPVVLVMVIVGYIIGFWKIATPKEDTDSNKKNNRKSDLKDFLIAFSPILITIIVTIMIDVISADRIPRGPDVAIAVLIGLVSMIIISQPTIRVLGGLFKNKGIYGITMAAYGAFLLRNVIDTPEIRQIFAAFIANGSADIILLMIITPAVLGLLTGSPVGGVAISVPILSGIIPSMTPAVAGLIYISAYLGYTIAPTHLCFTFTADYFKCSLNKIYKYVLPSFLLTFLTALIVYFFLPA